MTGIFRPPLRVSMSRFRSADHALAALVGHRLALNSPRSIDLGDPIMKKALRCTKCASTKPPVFTTSKSKGSRWICSAPGCGTPWKVSVEYAAPPDSGRRTGRVPVIDRGVADLARVFDSLSRWEYVVLYLYVFWPRGGERAVGVAQMLSQGVSIPGPRPGGSQSHISRDTVRDLVRSARRRVERELKRRDMLAV